jgi:hypothetical protein
MTLFKDAGENDCVVLMYSGHGENLADRDIGMIVPVDAKDEYDYLDLSIIKTRLDSFKCKHVFVVFDCLFFRPHFYPAERVRHARQTSPTISLPVLR